MGALVGGAVLAFRGLKVRPYANNTLNSNKSSKGG